MYNETCDSEKLLLPAAEQSVVKHKGRIASLDPRFVIRFIRHSMKLE